MRIGTRGSALALAQSGLVQKLLLGGEGRNILTVIETTGDRNPLASLRRIGGKGIFTKEIDTALLDRRIDLAVHSLKDLPTEETPGLAIGALLTREDPRDALVSRGGVGLDQLPQGAVVGTSSFRRRAQLLARRPDLTVEDLRGNVPTRIARVLSGTVDAIVIAAAGLIRLGMESEIAEILDESVMLPAPGQGIIAVQIRADDAETREQLRAIHDPAAEAEATAERTFLSALGGGCLVPVGARAVARDGRLALSGFVGHPEGRPSIRKSIEGPTAGAAELGAELARHALAQGAREILDAVRSDEVFP
ncbi:MAG TPA: hydroxymethylbilane synthase [Candidatus Eisenbacteria bacterium]|nr:hydroxymethylbilane synthase [Candidatus Eisenbacteria bacterium]